LHYFDSCGSSLNKCLDLFANSILELFDIDCVQDIAFHPRALDRLILRDTEKVTLRTLVAAHLRTHGKNEILPMSNQPRGFKDKDSNLIILLYGRPGSGKTFTATCIAEEMGRPLVSIAADVLSGSTVKDVNMNKTFALAQRWGAIVIMEDADNFLGGNRAEVSANLQAVDYYDGVLFLTSNKHDDFDEAIQPRLSHSITYGILKPEDRERLWKLLFQTAEAEGFELNVGGLVSLTRGMNYQHATRTGRDIQRVFTATKQLASQSGNVIKPAHLTEMLSQRQAMNGYRL
jgi:SpoVK/Ycf46/Vps4 family AAA+-type ATPase